MVGSKKRILVLNQKAYKLGDIINNNLSPRYLLRNMPGFIFFQGGGYYV